MTFNITAKFTLLDDNGNKVNDAEIGCAIDVVLDIHIIFQLQYYHVHLE